jgi:putative CocE/NonD family hydrolase
MRSAWFRLFSKKVGLPTPVVSNVSRRRIRIPLGDGVITLADHWIPQDRMAPLVLIRSPYGRRLINLLCARTLAHQGFQVVVQSCRGTDGSGGSFDRPFACEIEDGAATVAWLRTQPWYPGRFFTFGDSYLGWNQIALAPGADGDVAGMVLRVAPSSLYDMVWPGGTLNFKAAYTWALLAQRDPRLGVRSALRAKRWATKVVAVGKTPPLLSNYLTLSDGPIEFFDHWLTHPDRADWADSEIGSHLDQVSCPVLVQGGWYDLFLEDSVSQYQRVGQAELHLGPWTHADMLTKALGATMTDAVAFLRDVAGLQPRHITKPVRLIEINGGALSFDAWPVKPADTRRWQLGDSGQLGVQPAGRGVSFTFDPADPTPYVGGALNDATSGSKDNTALEARADVATFTTEPLVDDLRILGSPKVTLTLSSDRSDTAVFVRLCEVRPDGTSWNHADRLVRLSQEDCSPEGLWSVEVTLPPTCLHLPAGHRLRLQLSSGAYPRFTRHPGTAESPVTAREFHLATQTIHGGAVEVPLRVTSSLVRTPSEVVSA